MIDEKSIDELRQSLRNLFEAQQESRGQRIKQLESHLDSLRVLHKKRNNELDEIIEATIKRVLNEGTSNSPGSLQEPASPSMLADSSAREIGAEIVEIPFELTESNNISVAATLNGKDGVKLMFHTANRGVVMTDKAVERIKSLTFDKTGNASSWGGKTATRFSTNNNLQIGSFSLNDLSIMKDMLSGVGTDGKFGPDFFENNIIEIDYDRKVLRIHSSLPKIDDDQEKFDIVFENAGMFIEGQLEIEGKKHTARFLVHSGFGGTVLLDDKFVIENQLGAKLPTISEGELRDSFGNVLKTKKVLLPSLRIGRSEFPNVPVGIFDGSIGRQKMCVMGCEILRRFNILIDSKNATIYLKPNSQFDTEFAD